MRNRKLSRQKIHIHRNYTVEEVARALGNHRQTVRRWIKLGTLPALKDQKPMLILGTDLVAFIEARNKPKPRMELHHCRCFKCQAPRGPAFSSIEYHPNNDRSGNLHALCDVCGTVMHKHFSAGELDALRLIVEVTVVHADETLVGCAQPPSNVHLKRKK